MQQTEISFSNEKIQPHAEIENVSATIGSSTNIVLTPDLVSNEQCDDSNKKFEQNDSIQKKQEVREIKLSNDNYKNEKHVNHPSQNDIKPNYQRYNDNTKLDSYQISKMKTENLSLVPLNDVNNNKIDKQIETLNNGVICVTKSDFMCSLYITACAAINRASEEKRDSVYKEDLEKAILSINPSGNFKISETKCGLIASFTQETDADNLLLNTNLAEILRGPVQVARFSRKDSRYKQIVTLRDVPWSIPIQDICTALTYQGISFENVDRFRNNVRVEILDANHYENLISQGLNFFDAARFLAVPERWYRNSGPNTNMHGERIGSDSILQCYRCQGFWHVAANCRHLPRCVRCGEPHGVEFCPRPRNNPICCHCSGAHHAAYKNCPVRVQLMNAIPVSMSLSTRRSSSQSREVRSRCRT